MAISLKDLQRGASNTPPRILIFGVAGIGKTTFCANAPAPVFIQTEDGLGTIDAPAFPLARSFGEVREALQSLITEEHDYKTLVLDSLDWLEPLIWQEVCANNDVQSIEQIPYGKGFAMAAEIWRDYLDGINTLRDSRGMMIIQTAHSDIKRYESPEADSYDRYVIKLHNKAAGLVQEHSDCVFFANYKTAVVKENLGFNATRNKAVGSGDRVIHTQERPAFSAKNRYGLAPEIALNDNTWGALASNIPWFKQFLAEESVEVTPDAPQEETAQDTPKFIKKKGQ